MKLTFIAALELSGTPSLYFPVINPQASGDQVIAPTPERIKSESVKPKRALRLSHLSEHCGWLTDLVVEFRKLHLNFIPLEIVIFCLFTHRWYQVKLACNRVRLLVPKRGKQTVADELFYARSFRKYPSVSSAVHHDLHGTPAWRSPIHRHPLVYYKRHGSDDFWKISIIL